MSEVYQQQEKVGIGIKDVAKRCDVSVTTVSHAFSGKRPVSKNIKKSILLAAKELNYHPNLWAQNLVSGRTNIIGLLVNDFGSNPYDAMTYEQMEKNARRLGYHLWITTTSGDENGAEVAIANCQRMRVDGLVVGSSTVSDEQIRQLVSFGIPVATPSRFIKGCNTNTGSIQNGNGIRQVLQYLYDFGHRQTAFLGGFNDELTNQERLSAYKTHTQALGMEVNEDLIIHSSPDWSESEQAERLLAKSRNFTAIVCFNDKIAFNAMKVIKRHGLRVPEDISLTGFDDVPWCEICTPSLTSVRQDIIRLAKLTIEQLVANIQKGHKIKPQMIETRLVVRESCSRVNNTN